MASTTGLDLITAAMMEINACGQSGDLDGSDSAVGLQYLNRMIDSSSADPACIYTQKMDTVSLVARQQQYTIGKDPAGILTADFNITRPVRITMANLLLASGGVTVYVPLDVITLDPEWAAIPVQAIYTQPTRMYNAGGFTNGFSTLFFWAIPDQVYQVQLYSWQQNARLALISDAIDYPPGYEEFWVYNLAVRLAVPFGRRVSPDTRAMALEARHRIMALNAQTPDLATDCALIGRQTGQYNWLTGANNGRV